MYFPSFISFPWTIPLPSIPSISLPANIQRRFLSFVLKRALGRFVKAGSLDVERIQAQIGEGRVEIDGLELDTSEINSLLPSTLPVQITTGSLARVSAQIPFPNLWSAPLSISLDTLHIDLLLTSSSSTSGTKGKGRDQRGTHADLASSVTTAADEFLHDELKPYEEAELEASVRHSLVLSNVDEVPGAFPGARPRVPGGGGAGGEGEPLPHHVESTTVLAGLVEKVLARLEFKVKNVIVRITHSDLRHGGTFELRVGEIKYADESSSNAKEGSGQTTVRAVRISSVDLFLLPPHTPASPSSFQRKTSSSPFISRSSSLSSTSTRYTETDSASTASTATDGDRNDDHMMMSMAVADLRESVMASSVASGASIYQSAYQSALTQLPEAPKQSEHDDDQAEDPAEGPKRSRTLERPEHAENVENVKRAEQADQPVPVVESTQSQTRMATPTPDPKARLILSFGSEDIVLRMTTTRPLPPVPVVPPVEGSVILPRPPSTADQLPAVEMEARFGSVAVLVLPDQAATILSALQLVTHASALQKPTEVYVRDPSTVIQPRLKAKLLVKAIHAVIVYDLSAANSAEFHTCSEQYWQKPLSVEIPFGHLKLRLESLVAAYSSLGYVPPPPGGRDKRPGPSRRVSAGQRGPVPPNIALSLADVSIFEYLASAAAGDEDSPPGGFFPVFIFDANLPRQYEHVGIDPSPHGRYASSTPAFPEFGGVDWRNSGLQRRGAGGEKVWRVRQKGRGVLKGGVNAPLEDTAPVISVRADLLPTAAAVIDVKPIHVFLDLSLVERLLPMLHHISPAMKRVEASPALEPQWPAKSINVTRSEFFVLDDLNARAGRLAVSHKKEAAIVRCPMLRLSIRCPAPVDRRGTWGDGAHLRSGIVTLDLHGVDAHLGKSPEKKVGIVPGPQAGAGTLVQLRKMVFFFSRVPATKSGAFLVLGPLAPEPGDTDPTVLLPTVDVQLTTSRETGAKTTSVACSVPSVQAKIKQSTIEGLQFFADDLTHWLDGAFGDGSRPKPRDELKMIGSRFFGSSKASSSSASSSAFEEDEDEANAAMSIKLCITETSVALHVPRTEDVIAVPPTKQFESVQGERGEWSERVLALRASDLEAEVSLNRTGRQETVVSLSVLDADFADVTDSNGKPRHFMSRTTPLTLTATHNYPIVSLRFSSLTNLASGTKETNVKVALSSFTFFVNADISWINDLAAFAKTPEGVFEDVVPSEVTRIVLEVYQGSVHASPPGNSGAAVLVLGSLEVRTDVVSGEGQRVVDVGLGRSGVLLVDDVGATTELKPGHGTSVETWKYAGYAQLVDVIQFEAQLCKDTLSSEVLVDVVSCQVKITACADSLASLGPFIGDLTLIVPKKPVPDGPASHVQSPVALEQSINVFASVDQDAFNQIPDMISGMDLIEDDLPTNLDYLDHAARRDSKADHRKSQTGETLRSWETGGIGGGTDEEEEERFADEVKGETAKVLYRQPFELDDEEYWDALPPVSGGYLDDTKLGKVRVRVHDCSVNVLLYDGYDWYKTRKVIEDEMKAVRRKLEKIRQLLASGQAADDSIEGTRSVLFNSVYIGLDQSTELDSAALLAAIDEELDYMEDDGASVSSWQTDFPPGHIGTKTASRRAGGASRSGSGRTMRLKGKRLTRSKRPLIEISLERITVDVDAHGPEEPTASRVHVTVGAMEILDHVKTSTWKKFLTELKADSRGNVRETDADMVRVELVSVRPSLPKSTDEELRLRVKVLPLRLHVDQDALDFLKRFFSFSVPGGGDTTTRAGQGKQGQEPFFQHVEIFPVELKLDYKPKRVDYAALREGKTAELMNFFHFDGAEMTLRHITLSGVSGTSRLSTLLQDTWTPDVKANQLADVISGVSPIRSVVNVGSGVADLILLPIEQYRKDGRVARGVQRGTSSFVRSTALEMMKLGARLATGTQVILEKAEGVLGGSGGRVGESEMVGQVAWPTSLTPEDGSSEDERDMVSRYANQPTGAREGVEAAYKSLSRNVNAAAQTILAVPMEVYERSGDDGPLRAVVRAVPIAVLKPMIGASEAVSKTLLGVRNSLDPAGRAELGDKYKR